MSNLDGLEASATFLQLQNKFYIPSLGWINVLGSMFSLLMWLVF